MLCSKGATGIAWSAAKQNDPVNCPRHGSARSEDPGKLSENNIMKSLLSYPRNATLPYTREAGREREQQTSVAVLNSQNCLGTMVIRETAVPRAELLSAEDARQSIKVPQGAWHSLRVVVRQLVGSQLGLMPTNVVEERRREKQTEPLCPREAA